MRVASAVALLCVTNVAACQGRDPTVPLADASEGEGEAFAGLVAESLVLPVVRRSPDGRYVAVGMPPAKVVDLDTAAVVETVDLEGWIEAYREPLTDDVLIWNVNAGSVDRLGPSWSLTQTAAEAFVMAGPQGPLTIVDKATLDTEEISGSVTSLVVTDAATAALVDGVFTMIRPHHIVFNTVPAHLSPKFMATSSRALVAFDNTNLLVEADGTIVDLGAGEGASALLLNSGVVVYQAGPDVVALELDGSSRTLCAATTRTLDPYWDIGRGYGDRAASVVKCQFASRTVALVDIYTGDTIGEALDSHPLGVKVAKRSWATDHGGAQSITFNEGARHVEVPMPDDARYPTAVLLFNSAGSAAATLQGGVRWTIVSASTDTQLAWPESARRIVSLFDRTAVIDDNDGHAVVFLQDMEVMRTDTVLSSTESDAGGLVTVELPTGSTRPLLRAYRDGVRQELMSADSVSLAARHTAIAIVNEPGNAGGRNGVWAVRIP